MKTFSYKQAVQVIQENFTGAKILQVWDTVRELDIFFEDAAGRRWELLSTADGYFQSYEEFIIMECK